MVADTTFALIADWSGPFASVSVARDAAIANDLGEVLYLATGRRAYQRQTTMQYVGISNDLNARFNDPNHPINQRITGRCGIWIGEIVSHGVAGRRGAKHPVQHTVAVDRAEWALAYFLALTLNERKRHKPPPESLVLVNRWFAPDLKTRRIQRGHPDWPDFIEYDHDDATALIQWFGSPPRRRRLSGKAISDLALPPTSK